MGDRAKVEGFYVAAPAYRVGVARVSPSAADGALIVHAAIQGLAVTPTQLERWRAGGLLPANVRSYPGRGSRSSPAEGAEDLVVWLAGNARRGRRPRDLALLAFAAGLAVPEPTVRAAFLAAVDRVSLGPDEHQRAGAAIDPGDWAADVAARALDRGLAATVIPDRVRRIDQLLTEAGMDWTPPPLAQLDRGPVATEPLTGRDFATNAVSAVLLGGQELSGDLLGGMIRMLVPAESASPFASMVEHGTEAPEVPTDALLTETGGLAILPAGDLRDLLRKVIADAPLAVLRTAWQTSEDLHSWAAALCDAVEREAQARQAGPATTEWVVGTYLVLPRVFLTTALRGRRRHPADKAFAAVNLLMVREMILAMRAAAPGGHWHLLRDYPFLPTCLHPLLGVS